jgi:hypothetical protein
MFPKKHACFERPLKAFHDTGTSFGFGITGSEEMNRLEILSQFSVGEFFALKRLYAYVTSSVFKDLLECSDHFFSRFLLDGDHPGNLDNTSMAHNKKVYPSLSFLNFDTSARYKCHFSSILVTLVQCRLNFHRMGLCNV